MAPQTRLAEHFHQMKYRGEGESFREGVNRVASTLSDNDEHYHALRSIFSEQRFMPAGRVQSAVGSSRNTTPYNCFVSGTIEDSFVDGEGSIMQRATEAAATMRMGGGIGYDFSTLRPQGATIRKLQSHSSGPVSFMSIFDAICKCVASSGHRRGAQMGVMRVDHPDIEEFIHAKSELGKLERFNLSIAVTDEFMEAVEARAPFDLRWGGEVYSTVDAHALYETMMRATWDWAEPGVLFIDRINAMNNLWYCETLAATNPCVGYDTPILTKEYGNVCIGDVAGEGISVWNGEEWSLTTPRVTGHNQPMVTVRLSDGSSLRCTTAHKWVLANGSRVSADSLEVGDKLQKHSWPVIESGIDPSVDAYSQGFFSGDGWVKEETGGQYIGLYGPKQKIQHDWKAVSRREYAISGGYEGTNCDLTREYLYFGKDHFLSKTFVPDMATLQYRKEWLAGLVDSDGFVTKDSCIQVSSKDQAFLSRTKLMLNTMGINGTLSEMKDYYRLSISGNHANEIGLPLKRCAVSPVSFPKARFVKVETVEYSGFEETVFCFTESLRNQGIFNGVLTGQCAEQPLPPFGACLLGSFNMTKYIAKNKDGDWAMDWQRFDSDIAPVVRAMDNVVDVARYPLPQQEQEAKNKRRMGLGVTGMANAGEALGFPYGSEAYLEWQGRVLSMLRDQTYAASARLAGEKGAFPLYDEDKYAQGKFIQTLPLWVRSLIDKHGIRNSHLTSIAPTGTISLTADNCSSGIEPVFDYLTSRPINTPDGQVIEEVEDYGVRVFGVRGRRAGDLSVQEHVAVLTNAQQYVDSAVSKTCNMDGSVSWEAFKALYMDAWKSGAKGCTTFNIDGKRMALLTGKPTNSPPADNDNVVEEGDSCTVNPDTGRVECA